MAGTDVSLIRFHVPNELIVKGVRRVRAASAIMAACAACGRGASARADGERWGLSMVPESTAFVVPYDSAPGLRDVLLSGALVGRRVHVTGRCVGPRNRMLGQPPRPNPWQLEADGVAIYVVGAKPSECLAGRNHILSVMATVAEDTLPAIGDLPPAPRRYLKQIGVELK
ncbi:MAG: hypothetical protein ACRENH_06725 [Gemmatimonadaceae bacterium]